MGFVYELAAICDSGTDTESAFIKAANITVSARLTVGLLATIVGQASHVMFPCHFHLSVCISAAAEV